MELLGFGLYTRNEKHKMKKTFICLVYFNCWCVVCQHSIKKIYAYSTINRLPILGRDVLNSLDSTLTGDLQIPQPYV